MGSGATSEISKEKTWFARTSSFLQCKLNKNGFTLQMQEQVDVAIVMKAMELAYKNDLDSLTLVAGDGDFRDCVEFLTKTAGKRVCLIGYTASFNSTLTQVAGQENIYKLDDIWEHISEPIPESEQKKDSSEDEETNSGKGKKKHGKK